MHARYVVARGDIGAPMGLIPPVVRWLLVRTGGVLWYVWSGGWLLWLWCSWAHWVGWFGRTTLGGAFVGASLSGVPVAFVSRVHGPWLVWGEPSGWRLGAAPLRLVGW